MEQLKLSGLSMPNIDFSGARERLAHLDQLAEECKEKYGDDWKEHYLSLTDPDYGLDGYEKIINKTIYEGNVFSSDNHILNSRFIEKVERLFGKNWKKQILDRKHDPYIGSKLIEDAMCTGMWKELPPELYEEYHRQAGNANVS